MEKISFDNPTALSNFTRNKHMFLDSFELSIENKKNNLGKTVLKMQSQICRKIAMLVNKIAFKKSERKK